MKNKNQKIPFEIIERFAKRNGISLSDSVEMNESMLDYLDNAALTGTSVSPNKVQDEAWHNFILHTKDYANFCNQRYGKFIHHVPAGMNYDPLSNKVQKLLEMKTNGELTLSKDCEQSSCGKHLCSSDCNPPSGEPAGKTSSLVMAKLKTK